MHVICTETISTQMQESSSGQYKWWIRKTCQSKVTDAYNPTARRGTTAPSTPRVGWAFVADPVKLQSVDVPVFHSIKVH
jgi:hypothetical protein